MIFRVRTYNEIAGAIIVFVFIHMVNLCPCRKFSTKYLFHDRNMGLNVSTSSEVF